MNLSKEVKGTCLRGPRKMSTEESEPSLGEQGTCPKRLREHVLGDQGTFLKRPLDPSLGEAKGISLRRHQDSPLKSINHAII